jgi:hypothetical protein
MSNNVVKTIRQCRQLKNLLVEFNSKLDAFQECTHLSIRECVQILNEIGDPDTPAIIEKTIARFSESGDEEDADEDDHLNETPQETHTSPHEDVVSTEETESHEKESSPQEDTFSSNPTDTPAGVGIIKIQGYSKEIIVTNEGDIFVGKNKLIPYHTKYGVMVDLPLGDSKTKQILQHLLVAKAYLKPSPKLNDKIVHKNGNIFDCRPRNLGWQSETKVEKPRIDATDAQDISEALVACHFDEAATAKMLAERHKRATLYAIRRISNKEIFASVSDRYFDEKHHVVKQLPAVVNNPTVEDVITTADTESRDVILARSLDACRGSILKTFEKMKSVLKDVTIYEVFNAKQLSPRKVTEDDIAILIRCAKNSKSDIKETLRRECKLLVTDRQIVKATRRL